MIAGLTVMALYLLAQIEERVENIGSYMANLGICQALQTKDLR